MSQKFIKLKNKNERSTAFGKYFARAIYDKNFVGTKALADFIQTQASVKDVVFEEAKKSTMPPLLPRSKGIDLRPLTLDPPKN